MGDFQLEELFQEPGTGNSHDAGNAILLLEEETASCGVLASLSLKPEVCCYNGRPPALLSTPNFK